MADTIIPQSRFREALERRRQVDAELAQRASANARLWKENAAAAEQPDPPATPGHDVAAAMPRPRP